MSATVSESTIAQNRNCSGPRRVDERMAWSHGRPDKATALRLLAAGAVIEDGEQQEVSSS